MTSGYVQLPLWIIVASWSVVVGFICYIWNRMEFRVKRIEISREEILKQQATDPLLTRSGHDKICENRDKDFTSMLQDVKTSICKEIKGLEDKIPLMIENAILKQVTESFRGIQGKQGAQGVPGVQGPDGTYCHVPPRSRKRVTRK